MEREFDWKPWEDYKKTKELELPINEPPCKKCLLWKPQPKFVNTSAGIQFDGLICCHANEQYKDFSCFKIIK